VPQKVSNWRQYAVVIVVVLVVVGVEGYYAYQGSFQPNIQATNIQVGPSYSNPQTTTVQDKGIVSSSGSFSHTATANGSAYMVFGNGFSFVAAKQVTVSYTAAGQSGSNSFTVTAGQSYTLQIPLSSGQSVSGTFTVTGGSGNDIAFSIEQYTCSQSFPFSLVLVNSGNANGYATVVIQTEGGTHVYSNRYFVTQGQQEPVSGTATIQDCASHTLSAVVTGTKG